MHSLIPYIGGKGYFVSKIKKIIKGKEFAYIVEPFGGSAKFLLNIGDTYKKHVIVYNDIDKRLVDLFKTVQEYPEVLQLKLCNALRSRVLFNEYQQPSPDQIENAFREMYIHLYGYNGKKDTFMVRVSDINKYYGLENKIDNIRIIHNIIKYWIIECDTYQNIIKRYDHEDTLFYLDPPYLDHDFYRYNFTKSDMVELKNIIDKIKGSYILNHTLEPEFLKIFGEPKFIFEVTNPFDHKTKIKEGFWTNIKVNEHVQLSNFIK